VAETLVQGPVPKRASLAGDLVFIGGLLGTAYTTGALRGGPIGGTISTGVATTQFIFRALKADTQHLSSPPVPSIAERDPLLLAPAQLEQLKAAIRRERLLALPFVTGPARDC